ncbi:MAG: hypothetical protein AB7N76_33130 [Planctomycetota bacterium]
MAEYKVIAGRYQLDGADVVIENPLGRGTMQRILDHYTGEGFELVDSHFDSINREVILTLAKGVARAAAAPAAGGGAPMAAHAPAHAPAHAAPAPAAMIDDDGVPIRRRGGGGDSGGGRRRSKAELDRLYRDT